MAPLKADNVTHIVIHCTDTPEGRHTSVADVDAWHRQRGWACIGYHYLIGLNGEIWEGRPLRYQGAHARGYNGVSIGICYVGGKRGGKPADTRTPMQKLALTELVARLRRQFSKVTHVVGHRDLDPRKQCPCYDVTRE